MSKTCLRCRFVFKLNPRPFFPPCRHEKYNRDYLQCLAALSQQPPFPPFLFSQRLNVYFMIPSCILRECTAPTLKKTSRRAMVVSYSLRTWIPACAPILHECRVWGCQEGRGAGRWLWSIPPLAPSCSRPSARLSSSARAPGQILIVSG